MQTLSVTQAWAIALSQLSKFYPNEELVLMSNKTIEKSYGWVFFYNSKRFLETKSFLYSLVGVGPAIVNKFNGQVITCGSAYTYEYYVHEYESRLDGTQANLIT